MIQVTPKLKKAYDLFHESSLTLARMEANGLCVDLDFVFKANEELTKQKNDLLERLQGDKIWKQWRKKHGDKAVLGNNDQLGSIFFDDLGYKFTGEKTARGKRQFGVASFANVNHPFVKDYFKLEKIDKVLGTFLKGILTEQVDGFVHPFFNLSHITTYRSSSDNPNFHNFPTRDYEQAKWVRPAIRARKGRRLVCMDFKGIEVFIATCYHKDPTMVAYNKDPKSDMHRDSAKDCYLIANNEDISKKCRYVAKNMFVFPQFYGSYYIDCARHLWHAVGEHSLVLANGRSLHDHLIDQGITKLGACNPDEKPKKGTFENHIKEVEDHFWNVRFPVYKAWKDRWYADYRRRGYADYLTGFRVQGLFKRNEIINYPVQGVAFHCLLWCMNKLQKWITKNKMKSLLVAEIHDDLMADVPENEVQEYLGKAHELMTVDLQKEWDWIIVPISVEAEVTPIDGNWFQKKLWMPKNGVWSQAE